MPIQKMDRVQSWCKIGNCIDNCIRNKTAVGQPSVPKKVTPVEIESEDDADIVFECLRSRTLKIRSCISGDEPKISPTAYEKAMQIFFQNVRIRRSQAIGFSTLTMPILTRPSVFTRFYPHEDDFFESPAFMAEPSLFLRI